MQRIPVIDASTIRDMRQNLELEKHKIQTNEQILGSTPFY